MALELENMTAEPTNVGGGHQPLLFPPEESVWRKYSANHEFPLSTLTSVALHVFVVLLVVLFGALVFHWNGAEPPAVGMVKFSDDAGGGGELSGGANPVDTTGPEQLPGKVEDPEITNGPRMPADLHIVTNHTPNADLDDQSKSFDRDFRELRPDQSKLVGPFGKGGPGDHGGKGPGHGPGDGPGTEDGVYRAKRTDRWAIALSYYDGEGLYREWANLQAIILVPEGKYAAGQKQYRVFYDLSTKAPRGKLETIETMQTHGRTWFTDRNRESVAALARYLGYSPPPPFMAFFIPKTLEEELLAKERAYRKKTEEQLQGWETVFRVRRIGDRFDAIVLEQKRK